MVALPPGTLLQLLYLEERLKFLPAGHFIEIGPGSGEITKLLLDLGWKGVSYDLEQKTIKSLEKRLKSYVSNKQFKGIASNFLNSSTSTTKVDLVISCMVMEHFSNEEELLFMDKARQSLNNKGLMIGLVPSSPSHWGIEDDIAGHYRRYTKDSIKTLMLQNNWKLLHTSGLTFPISNFLLPLSNYLVNKSEKNKLLLTTSERTRLSGRRNVKFKTHFPKFISLFINKSTLTPLHYLQKLFSKSEKALVILFEAKPYASQNRKNTN